MSDNDSWLNENLVMHLLRRLARPGVAEIGMAETILSRMEHTAQPLPLLADLEQRWQNVMDAQADMLPFVYAQPVQPQVEAARNQQQAAVVRPKSSKVLANISSESPDLKVVKGRRLSSDVKPFPNHLIEQRPSPDASVRQTAVSPKNRSSQQHAPKSNPVGKSVQTQKPKAASASQARLAPETIAARKMSEAIPDLPVTAVSQLPIVKAKATAVAPSVPHSKNKPTSAAPKNLPTSAAVKAPEKMSTATKSSPVLADKPVLKTSADKMTDLPVVKPTLPQKLGTPRLPAAAPTAVTLPSVQPTPSPNTTPAKRPNLTNRTGELPLVRADDERMRNGRADLNLPTPASRVPVRSHNPAAAPTFKPPPARPSQPAVTSNVIQRQVDNEADVETPNNEEETAVDIDEIVEEVQRQFMRELAIESERRGVLPWQ